MGSRPEDITISRDSIIPLHQQVLNQLRHLILSGAWPPGTRVPSETELQRHLGISRGTIRQALNRAEAEGLIERVPGKGTFVAVTARARETRGFIGYITSDFMSEFQRQLLQGAESTAREQGYRIIFCNSNGDVREEDRLLEQLIADQVDGILIWPSLSETSHRVLFRLVQEGRLPIVFVDRTLDSFPCDCVLSDNFGGGYAATRHLIDLGHRRIAFLSRPVLRLVPVAERYEGHRQAMVDAGLEPSSPLLVGVPDKELGPQEALQAYRQGTSDEIQEIAGILRRSDRPTAIFAMNDLMALQVLRAAEHVGLGVPDDLSLVGFDDMDIITQIGIPLTTVAQDTFAVGQRAAELLIERIEGYRGPARREVIATRLQVRQTTSAPPKDVSVSA